MSFYHTKNTMHFVSLTLVVKDINRMIDFYTRIIGLDLIKVEGSLHYLGIGEKDLVFLVLDYNPDAIIDSNLSGLYHFALLLPQREDLSVFARWIKNLGLPIYGANHLVSEAIYLTDPEGNGIEIYYDTNVYQIDQNKEIVMETKPLDLDSLLSLSSKSIKVYKLPSNTKLGHLHFYVTNLDDAMAFYSLKVGFKLTLHYGYKALFLSDNGYHHHVGINTWKGEGINHPESINAGLKNYQLFVPESKYQALINHADGKDELGTFLIDSNGIKMYLIKE